MGMQESGGDYDTGGFGSASGGGYSDSAPKRGGGKAASNGGAAKGGFDKALDDEIPF